MMHGIKSNNYRFHDRFVGSNRGFSLIEILVALLIGSLLTAMAIPATQSALASYQLDAAVNSVTGAIQGTRYQAIMHGYLYQVDIDPTANTFQVSSEPGGAASFTPIGSAIPVSGSPVTISAGTSNGSPSHATLQFKANGAVLVASGQTPPLSFTISYKGTTKTLTVSNYGSISVQ
ncbi:MAG: prepilin-type N-terminal cleavage/methylation domain-containing protein [Candidatus Acidiferrales bacterium]